MKTQRLEKYYERFDNKDNELVQGVFNPNTWGKRMVEKPKQETAVEWLVNKLNDDFENNDFLISYANEIEQAKKMEKEQIMDAYQQGFNNAYFSNPLSKEQYYNEQFKNK
jgi:disulfide oxidoreductase YuzD